MNLAIREGFGIKCNSLSNKRAQRGQAFVEISILLPIVMLLFFGMIEVAWAAHSYIVVSSAAREGARFGSRGVHLPLSDIESIVVTTLGRVIVPDFYGPNANTAIIVTEIDVDEDGSYNIYQQGIKGDLPVLSTVCEPGGEVCSPASLNIQEFIDANIAFNSNPEFCVESFGCDGDFVVVEVVYMHQTLVMTGFARAFIPDPFPIRARAVMRILHRRPPQL